MSDQTTTDGAPSDLITAVVNLVGTGPAPLGADTPAEIAAVGGLINGLSAIQGPRSGGGCPLPRCARSDDY